MIAYKYRGGSNFARDLDSIAGDSFYAASLATLNDPFEATYSVVPMEKLLNLMERFIGKDPSLTGMKVSLQEVLHNVDRAGIFSLAARPDDLKLWAHYGSNYTGFCVGYDVAMLEKFNGYTHYSHYLVRVKYSKKPAALSLTDVGKSNLHDFLQKVLGTKHPEWQHEGETRIITDATGLMPHDFRAIKSIHFGLNMPLQQMEEVMLRMQGRGITYYKMERSLTTYGLKVVSVTDPFVAAPHYLYHVASVTDYALDTCEEGEEKNALLPYLHKAIEIQRRDPYCSEVCYADRCTDKTRAGQVYVNYFYGIQYYNRYFTKDEIEILYSSITDLAG